MNSVASIKDRLKNKSRETGRTLQELFTLYGLERTIYRLSVSPYKENFVLNVWMTDIPCFMSLTAITGVYIL